MIESRAIRLKNGSTLLVDKKLDHGQYIQKERLTAEDVNHGGFIINGRYLERNRWLRKIVIIQASDKSFINTTLGDLGYGFNNFSIPCGEIDGLPTHFVADIEVCESMWQEFTTVFSGKTVLIYDEGTLEERERNGTGLQRVLKALGFKLVSKVV